MLASVKIGSLRGNKHGIGAQKGNRLVAPVLPELDSICTRRTLTSLFFVPVWHPQSTASAIKARKRLNRHMFALILHTTKPQHANKVKNYGQTIQQSRKPKTPEQLPQTQEDRDQGQKSPRAGRRAKSGLTGRFEEIEKAALRAAFLIWQGCAAAQPDDQQVVPTLFRRPPACTRATRRRG